MVNFSKAIICVLSSTWLEVCFCSGCCPVLHTFLYGNKAFAHPILFPWSCPRQWQLPCWVLFHCLGCKDSELYSSLESLSGLGYELLVLVISTLATALLEFMALLMKSTSHCSQFNVCGWCPSYPFLNKSIDVSTLPFLFSFAFPCAKLAFCLLILQVGRNWLSL